MAVTTTDTLVRKKVLWKAGDDRHTIRCVACAQGTGGRVIAWGGEYEHVHSFLFILREGCDDGAPRRLQGRRSASSDDGEHEGGVSDVALTHGGLIWDVTGKRPMCVIKRLELDSKNLCDISIAIAQQWMAWGRQDGHAMLWRLAQFRSPTMRGA